MTKEVLIYPYWNVNAAESPTNMFMLTVLIYPYWNVNVSLLGR